MTNLQRSALVGFGVVALALGAVGCGGSEIQYGSGYATTTPVVYTTGYSSPPVYYSNGYYNGGYYRGGYAPGYRRGYVQGPYRGRVYAAPRRAYAAPQVYRGGRGGVVVQPTAPRYSGPARGGPRGGRVVVRGSAPSRGYSRGGGGGFRGGAVRGGAVVRRR